MRPNDAGLQRLPRPSDLVSAGAVDSRSMRRGRNTTLCASPIFPSSSCARMPIDVSAMSAIGWAIVVSRGREYSHAWGAEMRSG
jgi:hypothetical protein